MNEKILKDPTVQLLKSVGFSDDYILKGIESGEIILKSEDAAGAHESETKQETISISSRKKLLRKKRRLKKMKKKLQKRFRNQLGILLQNLLTLYLKVCRNQSKD